LLGYGDFSIFQECCRPPSWIYDTRVWIAHEGDLVVFITAKFGWNRCGNFDNMHVFIVCELGSVMAFDLNYTQGKSFFRSIISVKEDK